VEGVLTRAADELEALQEERKVHNLVLNLFDIVVILSLLISMVYLLDLTDTESGSTNS
jgi:hypothetical protein